MKRVYLGLKELTTIATVTNGGGGGDDTQKWVDYFNGTLTEFTVPEGVKSINTATFNTFTGLTSLTLPSSITSIDRTEMHGMGGESNPFSTLKTMTVKATTPPTLPDYDKAIPTTISRIDVPATSVDKYKSASGWSDYADKILEIGASMNVTYTDNTEKTFYNLTSIESDTDPNKKNAKNVEIYFGVTIIGNNAFNGCSSLTGVTLPDSLTNIGDSAFNGCSSLTGITLPDSLTNIGDLAFNHCQNIKSITIPENVASIGQEAIAWCTNLETMTVKATTPPTLGSNALPDELSTIYVLEETVDTYKSADGWKDYSSKIQATIPSIIVTYTDGTIKKYYYLTKIESQTIENRGKIKEFVLGNSVTEIGVSAFNGEKNLETAVIPDSVKIIESWAFAWSKGLKSVIIGSGITSIGVSCFQGCTSLTSVTIKNSTNKLTYSSDMAKDISSYPKLYVPSNLLADYQADSAWTGAFKGGIYAIQ